MNVRCLLEQEQWTWRHLSCPSLCLSLCNLECCVTFVPDANVFQQMKKEETYDLKVTAYVSNTYTCGAARRDLLNLNRELGSISVAEAVFELKTDEDEGCEFFFVICWIKYLLQFFFGFRF